MSWSPIYYAINLLLIILFCFYWLIGFTILVIFFSFVYLYVMILEVLEPYDLSRYSKGFWLFILSEVAIFGSLFAVVMWSDEGAEGSLSDSLELPLLGCFLLLTSSLTATVYHHSFGLPYSGFFLGVSVILGSCFIFLQLWEFFECECDLLYSTFFGAAFCTVGLHFLHVFAGVVAMVVLLILGSDKNHYYASLVVWYWHFVDYIWLWVYLLIYYV